MTHTSPETPAAPHTHQDGDETPSDVEGLRRDLALQSQRLAEQQARIDDLSRSRAIDELLLAADVADLEAARLLTEVAAGADDEPDLPSIVEALKRQRPFLFRCPAPPAGALGPRPNGASPAQSDLLDAGARAGETGRRQDLLKYLRLRRG